MDVSREFRHFLSALVVREKEYAESILQVENPEKIFLSFANSKKTSVKRAHVQRVEDLFYNRHIQICTV